MSLANSMATIADSIFRPKSIAIIGALSDPDKEYRTGWVGRLSRFGYAGRIYPVNPKADTILSIPCYHSILDISDTIDYAIVAVPRQAVNRVIGDCIKKQVKVVHVFSAGFTETGTDFGKGLQSELERTLSTGNTRLIGTKLYGRI